VRYRWQCIHHGEKTMNKERDSLRGQLGRNDVALRPQTEKQPRETSQPNPKPSRSKSKQPTRQDMAEVDNGCGGMHAILFFRSPQLRRQRRLLKRPDNYDLYIEQQCIVQRI
jgi:hypothetical protein